MTGCPSSPASRSPNVRTRWSASRRATAISEPAAGLSGAVRRMATAAWIRWPAQYISWLEASLLYRGSPLTWM